MENDVCRFPVRWIVDPRIKALDKAVLLVMATYADEDGRACPTVASVAECLGMTERSVQYAMRRLKELGALVVLPRFAAVRGRDRVQRRAQRSNWYVIAGFTDGDA
jgi:hypothetical protein